MPVIDLTFDGPYGVYHSAYDDFYWMSHFGDPQFRYHALMAQLWGVLVMRLANADFLPYDFGSYGAHIRGYLDTLAKKTDVSKLALNSLRAAIDDFEHAGRALNGTIEAVLASERIDALLADQINRGMMDIERNWLDPQGIPGRPWYRHLLYACRQTYAHLELPGLTETAESGDSSNAQEQARILETALRKNALLLNQLNEELACAGGITKQGRSLCPAP